MFRRKTRSESLSTSCALNHAQSAVSARQTLSRLAPCLVLDNHVGLMHQVLKECAIVNHRAAQIFSAGLPARMTQCDRMCRTIILRHHGMIDLDIGRALLKIADRITARRHHVAEQLIGLRHRARRRIHKTGLHLLPGSNEPRAIGCG